MNRHESTHEQQVITDELVAYLDGELDDSTRDRIEQRLATDANVRQQLNQLRDCWDLLSELPTAEPTELFARSTVEMVAISAEADLHEQRGQLRRKRFRTYGFLVAAIALSAVLGFAVVKFMIPDPDAPLLRDLPVIENLDTYVYADDVDFVKRLYREGLFVAETNDEN